MTLITTTDVQNGTLTDASVMNANFGAIKTVVNGNIDNSNISASAAIALSKLAQGGASSGQAMIWNGSAWAPGGGATLVTALPGSPNDGDTVVFTDSTSAPTYMWYLRYISAATTYKWYCIGGTPAHIEVLTSETTASGTYAALATAGPSFTIPLAGDWAIHIESRQTHTAAQHTYHSFDIGGTGAVDNDSILSYHYNAAANANTFSVGRTVKKTALSASTALVSKYRTDSGTGTFAMRVMEVIPYRVN